MGLSSAPARRALVRPGRLERTGYWTVRTGNDVPPSPGLPDCSWLAGEAHGRTFPQSDCDGQSPSPKGPPVAFSSLQIFTAWTSGLTTAGRSPVARPSLRPSLVLADRGGAFEGVDGGLGRGVLLGRGLL